MKKFFATLSALAIIGAFSSAAKADISIAAVGPLTGQYASFGKQIKDGAQMAIKDINAAGGILGQKIKLLIEDDACDPKQAVAVANKVAGSGVVFVAGHFCSGSSIPASKVYEEEGIVQISPASTNPKYTDEGVDLIFSAFAVEMINKAQLLPPISSKISMTKELLSCMTKRLMAKALPTRQKWQWKSSAKNPPCMRPLRLAKKTTPLWSRK